MITFPFVRSIQLLAVRV